ncbi:MAG: energy transducer TonB [Giesbergeria sp.]
MPRRAARWPRRAGSWLVVVLAHGVVVALVLSISPQARQVLDQVIQASLILPQPLPVAPPEPPKPPEPRPQPKKKMLPPPRPTPVLAAAPRAEAAPAPFVVPPAPVEPAPAAPVEPASVVAAPVAPPAPLVPPVFNANYLENPAPQYPPASRRMGEQGQVMLRVYVSSNGRAERVDIKTSSGFDRLDRAAMDAVQGWRFVPARRGEEVVAAWVLVPVSFVMKVS